MTTTTNRPRRLTRRQEAFITAYLGKAKLNASEAARIVGYQGDNADVVGPRMLVHVGVRARIDAVLAQRARTSGEVLGRLEEIAFLDARTYLTVGPDGKMVFDWSKAKEDGKLHLIEEAQNTEFGIKVRFPSSLAALQLLAKYHGLLTERSEITVKTDVAELRNRILSKLSACTPN